MVHGSHTKNDIFNAFRPSFKMTKKNIVSNIFYHFLFAVSLGRLAPKMSKKFRLDRKIGFQNMFYTKYINVIIDSIGPSIILRSIFCKLLRPRSFEFGNTRILQTFYHEPN